MPNSFWGAKTCFTNGGVVISYQFLHLTIIQEYSKLSLLSCCNKKYGIIWELFPKGGGGSPIPKTLSKFTNMVLEMFPLIQNGLTLFKYIFICTVSTNLGCQSQKKVPVYYQVARIKPCWPKFPGIWRKLPGYCMIFCDFARISVI